MTCVGMVPVGSHCVLRSTKSEGTASGPVHVHRLEVWICKPCEPLWGSLAARSLELTRFCDGLGCVEQGSEMGTLLFLSFSVVVHKGRSWAPPPACGFLAFYAHPLRARRAAASRHPICSCTSQNPFLVSILAHMHGTSSMFSPVQLLHMAGVTSRTSRRAHAGPRAQEQQGETQRGCS